VKTNKKILSLAVNMDVIRRTEAGERQIDVCKALGMVGSTVQCILKNEDKIKDENGKKRAEVQLSLDSLLSRKEWRGILQKEICFLN
jgi:hypothetical protein